LLLLDLENTLRKNTGTNISFLRMNKIILNICSVQCLFLVSCTVISENNMSCSFSWCLICHLWHSTFWKWHHAAEYWIGLEVYFRNQEFEFMSYGCVMKSLDQSSISFFSPDWSRSCDYLLLIENLHIHPLNDRICYTDMILLDVEAPKTLRNF
jgi:hypothetical protein